MIQTQIAQGAALYILVRNDLSVIPATVVNVSQPHISKAAQSNPTLALQGFVVDLTLNLGMETTTIEFPVNSTSANYPEKGWFVSNDRQAVAREIEADVNMAEQELNRRPYYEQRVRVGKESLIKLTPERQKEAQQAAEIQALRAEIEEMKRSNSESGTKLDKVLALLSVETKKKSKEE